MMSWTLTGLLLLGTYTGTALCQHVFKPLYQTAGADRRTNTGRQQVTTEARCSYSRQNYRMSWEYEPGEGFVHFTLSYAPSQTGSYWTGVGFGPYMSDMDFVQVVHDRSTGRVQVSDAYARWYRPPRLDAVDNVWAISRRLADDGRLTVHFARPLAQSEWADKSLEGCQYYLFPYSGGDVTLSELSGAAVLHKHWATPDVRRVCDVQVHCRRAPVHNRLDEAGDDDEDERQQRLAVLKDVGEHRQQGDLVRLAPRDRQYEDRKMAMVSKRVELPLTVTPAGERLDQCDRAGSAGDEHWCRAYVGAYRRWWRTYRRGRDVSGQLCELLKYVRNMCCETLIEFGCSYAR